MKYPWRDWRAIQNADELAAFESQDKALVLRAQRAAYSYAQNNALQIHTRKMKVRRGAGGGELWWRVVAQYADAGVQVRWSQIFDLEFGQQTEGGVRVCVTCARLTNNVIR